MTDELTDRAASPANETVSDFARTAVEERAAAIIREHDLVTRASPDFFDDLLAALDAPPAEPNDALSLGAALLDTIITERR
ncbi:hypothetical protein BL253_00870 [Pseudofrankia asymbiotica]|uniref:Uncharacterized protein n=1 Tax=Pseudofrankia asymbiotica TaxID=1834516 RepID=A0A1V2IK81_9ACTN|nr:hypothetical protein BL253_00870 [Pseudofrankia asymbiotica]